MAVVMSRQMSPAPVRLKTIILRRMAASAVSSSFANVTINGTTYVTNGNLSPNDWTFELEEGTEIAMSVTAGSAAPASAYISVNGVNVATASPGTSISYVYTVNRNATITFEVVFNADGSSVANQMYGWISITES